MSEQQPMTSLGGCFLRVFWMLFGPSVMAVIGLALIANRFPIGSPLDFVFLGVMVLVIGARFLDANRAGGRPGVFTIVMFIFAGAVFVVAHVVAPALFPTGA